jgi:hypothetical protein
MQRIFQNPAKSIEVHPRFKKFGTFLRLCLFEVYFLKEKGPDQTWCKKYHEQHIFISCRMIPAVTSTRLLA